MRLWRFASLGVLMLLLPAPSGAAPCTAAMASCTEWIDVPGSAGRLLVYRTYPIGTNSPNVTRALILVHGASRDADNYFRHALAAAFLAGALENTIVLSPRFASNNKEGCRDTFADRELKWQCNGPGRWTAAVSYTHLTLPTIYSV